MTTQLAPVAEEKVYRKVRARSLGRAEQAPADEVVALRLLNDAEEPYERPKTRADCEQIVRPCPFVGCKHHLYLDVTQDNGNIRINFPDREPHQMPPDGSCALDVAEQGGVTLSAAGDLVNLTRERIRQVEVEALRKLRTPPAMRPRGKALADAMAILRTFADHETQSVSSPLAEEMLETTSDAREDDDDSDVRRFKVDLPHILDESVSNEDYCSALHRIWDQWTNDRQALSKGELHVVRGQYVTARHIKVLDAIRTSCKDRGAPPSVMEIADIAEVKGTTMSSRRQNASAILRSLRELGLIEGKRAALRVVDGALPAQTQDAAE
jgi:hypothetical protein